MVRGGEVAARGAGTAISGNVLTAAAVTPPSTLDVNLLRPVTATPAGVVAATTGRAIAVAGNSNISVLDGLAFAFGTSRTDVLTADGAITIRYPGTMVAWNTAPGRTTYDQGSNIDIIVDSDSPNVVVTWGLNEGRSGINYVTSYGAEFFEVAGVTVTGGLPPPNGDPRIALSPSAPTTIDVGATQRITATIHNLEGAGEVAFEVSQTVNAVEVVDYGPNWIEVRGLAVGTANVTATYGNLPSASVAITVARDRPGNGNGSSSSGCNAGFGFAGLLGAALLFLRRN